jgi:hypothetical protein
VQLPGAEPLRAQDLQRFRDMSAPLLADLSPSQPPAAVAAVAPSTGTVPSAASGSLAAPTASAGAVPSGAPEPRSKTSVN